MESDRLKEIDCPRRRTGWASGGQAQMGEDFGNDRGTFDGGNDRQGAATVRTVCHIDLKHPFEQLGPAHAGPRWGM